MRFRPADIRLARRRSVRLHSTLPPSNPGMLDSRSLHISTPVAAAERQEWPTRRPPMPLRIIRRGCVAAILPRAAGPAACPPVGSCPSLEESATERSPAHLSGPDRATRPDGCRCGGFCARVRAAGSRSHTRAGGPGQCGARACFGRRHVRRSPRGFERGKSGLRIGAGASAGAGAAEPRR
jgi:hypothetical protein